METKLLILYCAAGLHALLTLGMVFYHGYHMLGCVAGSPRHLVLALALLGSRRVNDQARHHRARVYAYLVAAMVSASIVVLAYKYLPAHDLPVTDSRSVVPIGP